MTQDPGRRAHYADFYDGLADSDGDRPLLAVVGNCQAESLRLALEHDDVRTVRLPAVHEWTADDLPPLDALLGRLDLLVAQPVGDDYRGLPVGTRQLLERTGARHALVSSLRYAGRQPYHVLVHPPHLRDPDPPLAPYHDLRTVVASAWSRTGSPAPSLPPLTETAVLAVAQDSVDEMARRERALGTVPVSDLLVPQALPPFRTVNHPGNALLFAVAARLRTALGLASRTPRVDRPLLDHLHAPVDPAVARVFGDEPARASWIVGGLPLSADEVRAAQFAWYDTRPDVVDEVLSRSERQLRHLGLRQPVTA